MRIGGIEAGPPLSTILGNYGINAIKFVKDLNELVQGLPTFLFLVINVFINEDKSYKIDVSEPSTGQFIKFVSYKKNFYVKGQGGLKLAEFKAIKLKDIYSICKLKYGKCDESSIKILYGTVNSFNFVIVNED